MCNKIFVIIIRDTTITTIVIIISNIRNTINVTNAPTATTTTLTTPVTTLTATLVPRDGQNTHLNIHQNHHHCHQLIETFQQLLNQLCYVCACEVDNKELQTGVVLFHLIFLCKLRVQLNMYILYTVVSLQISFSVISFAVTKIVFTCSEQLGIVNVSNKPI